MESYTLSNALPAFIEYGTQLDLEFFLCVQVVLGMFGALRDVPVYNLPLFLYGLYAYQNRDSVDPLKQLNHCLVDTQDWSSLGPYGGDNYGRYQSLGDPLLDVDERDAQEVHIPRHDRYPSSIRRYSSHHSQQSHTSYSSHHHNSPYHSQQSPPHWNNNHTSSSVGSGGIAGELRGAAVTHHGAAATANSHGTPHSGASYPGSIGSGRASSSLRGGDGVLSDSASGSIRKEEESGYSPAPAQQQAPSSTTAVSSTQQPTSEGMGLGMLPMSPGRASGQQQQQQQGGLNASTSPGTGGITEHDAPADDEGDNVTTEKKRKSSRK
ncbi:hypothetical protein BGW41_007404 [Actinomortierella wolfii]|nr:hypothetical protein BGW41_007404 [Actinomortierella wolfii]